MLLACLAVLPGCATDLAEPGKASASAPRAAPLLHYATSLAALTRPELARQRLALERAYARDPTSLERMKLALLLREPRTPGRDLARARRLLSEEAKAPEDTGAGSRELAEFVLRTLDELELEAAGRLDAERAATRAEQRVARLERINDGLRTSATREHERRVALEKQLEALKAIEHQINERARPDSVPESPIR